MPPTPYKYFSEEEKAEAHRKRDRELKFIKTWRTRYKIDVTRENVAMLQEHKTIIRKILPILDFIKTIEYLE